MTKKDSQRPRKTKMKKQTIFLILLLSCQVFAANKSTFINMQTADGIIHYPIIVSVTETDVIIDGQAAIPISSINSVTAYGSVNPILPIIAGAGCGYLGIIGGVIVGFIMSPESLFGDESEMDKVGTVAFLGGGIGAVSGYTMVHKILASRSQNIVAMESWTFEKKRNFLFSELKP
jgi:hypothetical protein